MTPSLAPFLFLGRFGFLHVVLAADPLEIELLFIGILVLSAVFLWVLSQLIDSFLDNPYEQDLLIQPYVLLKVQLPHVLDPLSRSYHHQLDQRLLALLFQRVHQCPDQRLPHKNYIILFSL